MAKRMLEMLSDCNEGCKDATLATVKTADGRLLVALLMDPFAEPETRKPDKGDAWQEFDVIASGPWTMRIPVGDTEVTYKRGELRVPRASKARKSNGKGLAI